MPPAPVVGAGPPPPPPPPSHAPTGDVDPLAGIPVSVHAPAGGGVLPAATPAFVPGASGTDDRPAAVVSGGSHVGMPPRVDDPALLPRLAVNPVGPPPASLFHPPGDVGGEILGGAVANPSHRATGGVGLPAGPARPSGPMLGTGPSSSGSPPVGSGHGQHGLDGLRKMRNEAANVAAAAEISRRNGNRWTRRMGLLPEASTSDGDASEWEDARLGGDDWAWSGDDDWAPVDVPGPNSAVAPRRASDGYNAPSDNPDVGPVPALTGDPHRNSQVAAFASGFATDVLGSALGAVRAPPGSAAGGPGRATAVVANGDSPLPTGVTVAAVPVSGGGVVGNGGDVVGPLSADPPPPSPAASSPVVSGQLPLPSGATPVTAVPGSHATTDHTGDGDAGGDDPSGGHLGDWPAGTLHRSALAVAVPAPHDRFVLLSNPLGDHPGEPGRSSDGHNGGTGGGGGPPGGAVAAEFPPPSIPRPLTPDTVISSGPPPSPMSSSSTSSLLSKIVNGAIGSDSPAHPVDNEDEIFSPRVPVLLPAHPVAGGVGVPPQSPAAGSDRVLRSRGRAAAGPLAANNGDDAGADNDVDMRDAVDVVVPAADVVRRGVDDPVGMDLDEEEGGLPGIAGPAAVGIRRQRDEADDDRPNVRRDRHRGNPEAGGEAVIVDDPAADVVMMDVHEPAPLGPGAAAEVVAPVRAPAGRRSTRSNPDPSLLGGAGVSVDASSGTGDVDGRRAAAGAMAGEVLASGLGAVRAPPGSASGGPGQATVVPPVDAAASVDPPSPTGVTSPTEPSAVAAVAVSGGGVVWNGGDVVGPRFLNPPPPLRVPEREHSPHGSPHHNNPSVTPVSRGDSPTVGESGGAGAPARSPAASEAVTPRSPAGQRPAGRRAASASSRSTAATSPSGSSSSSEEESNDDEAIETRWGSCFRGRCSRARRSGSGAAAQHIDGNQPWSVGRLGSAVQNFGRKWLSTVVSGPSTEQADIEEGIRGDDDDPSHIGGGGAAPSLPAVGDDHNVMEAGEYRDPDSPYRGGAGQPATHGINGGRESPPYAGGAGVASVPFMPDWIGPVLVTRSRSFSPMRAPDAVVNVRPLSPPAAAVPTDGTETTGAASGTGRHDGGSPPLPVAAAVAALRPRSQSSSPVSPHSPSAVHSTQDQPGPGGAEEGVVHDDVPRRRGVLPLTEAGRAGQDRNSRRHSSEGRRSSRSGTDATRRTASNTGGRDRGRTDISTGAAASSWGASRRSGAPGPRGTDEPSSGRSAVPAARGRAPNRRVSGAALGSVPRRATGGRGGSSSGSVTSRQEGLQESRRAQMRSTNAAAAMAGYRRNGNEVTRQMVLAEGLTSDGGANEWPDAHLTDESLSRGVVGAAGVGPGNGWEWPDVDFSVSDAADISSVPGGEPHQSSADGRWEAALPGRNKWKYDEEGVMRPKFRKQADEVNHPEDNTGEQSDAAAEVKGVTRALAAAAGDGSGVAASPAAAAGAAGHSDGGLPKLTTTQWLALCARNGGNLILNGGRAVKNLFCKGRGGRGSRTDDGESTEDDDDDDEGEDETASVGRIDRHDQSDNDDDDVNGGTAAMAVGAPGYEPSPNDPGRVGAPPRVANTMSSDLPGSSIGAMSSGPSGGRNRERAGEKVFRRSKREIAARAAKKTGDDTPVKPKKNPANGPHVSKNWARTLARIARPKGPAADGAPQGGEGDVGVPSAGSASPPAGAGSPGKLPAASTGGRGATPIGEAPAAAVPRSEFEAMSASDRVTYMRLRQPEVTNTDGSNAPPAVRQFMESLSKGQVSSPNPVPRPTPASVISSLLPKSIGKVEYTGSAAMFQASAAAAAAASTKPPHSRRRRRRHTPGVKPGGGLRPSRAVARAADYDDDNSDGIDGSDMRKMFEYDSDATTATAADGRRPPVQETAGEPDPPAVPVWMGHNSGALTSGRASLAGGSTHVAAAASAPAGSERSNKRSKNGDNKRHGPTVSEKVDDIIESAKARRTTYTSPVSVAEEKKNKKKKEKERAAAADPGNNPDVGSLSGGAGAPPPSIRAFTNGVAYAVPVPAAGADVGGHLVGPAPHSSIRGVVPVSAAGAPPQSGVGSAGLSEPEDNISPRLKGGRDGLLRIKVPADNGIESPAEGTHQTGRGSATPRTGATRMMSSHVAVPVSRGYPPVASASEPLALSDRIGRILPQWLGGYRPDPYANPPTEPAKGTARRDVLEVVSDWINEGSGRGRNPVRSGGSSSPASPQAQFVPEEVPRVSRGRRSTGLSFMGDGSGSPAPAVSPDQAPEPPVLGAAQPVSTAAAAPPKQNFFQSCIGLIGEMTGACKRQRAAPSAHAILKPVPNKPAGGAGAGSSSTGPRPLRPAQTAGDPVRVVARETPTSAFNAARRGRGAADTSSSERSRPAGMRAAGPPQSITAAPRPVPVGLGGANPNGRGAATGTAGRGQGVRGRHDIGIAPSREAAAGAGLRPVVHVNHGADIHRPPRAHDRELYRPQVVRSSRGNAAGMMKQDRMRPPPQPVASTTGTVLQRSTEGTATSAAVPNQVRPAAPPSPPQRAAAPGTDPVPQIGDAGVSRRALPSVAAMPGIQGQRASPASAAVPKPVANRPVSPPVVTPRNERGRSHSTTAAAGDDDIDLTEEELSEIDIEVPKPYVELAKRHRPPQRPTSFKRSAWKRWREEFDAWLHRMGKQLRKWLADQDQPASRFEPVAPSGTGGSSTSTASKVQGLFMDSLEISEAEATAFSRAADERARIAGMWLPSGDSGRGASARPSRSRSLKSGGSGGGGRSPASAVVPGASAKPKQGQGSIGDGMAGLKRNLPKDVATTGAAAAQRPSVMRYILNLGTGRGGLDPHGIELTTASVPVPVPAGSPAPPQPATSRASEGIASGTAPTQVRSRSEVVFPQPDLGDRGPDSGARAAMTPLSGLGAEAERVAESLKGKPGAESGLEGE